MSHVTAKTSFTNNKHLSAIPEANTGGHVTGAGPKQALCSCLELRCLPLTLPSPSSRTQDFPNSNLNISFKSVKG